MKISDKNYNFTEPPNKGVQDKAPEWMDSFFEKVSEKDTDKAVEMNKEPFNGVKDPILNPLNKGVQKSKSNNCSCCGKPLAPNEVGTCSNCL